MSDPIGTFAANDPTSAVERPLPSGSDGAWASDVAAEMLRRLEIPFVALNPGASFRGLHDSLVNHNGNSDPQMLLCLHEEHAVAIAHGWAKVTGRPMAAIVHSNVGLMHATMAVFNAWCDRVPLLLLGATGPVDAVKRRPWIDWIHTARDQAALVRPYIKWDDQPASVGAMVESLLRAGLIATTAPRGPVYVCLDAGLQESRIDAMPSLPDAGRYRAPAPAIPEAQLAGQAAEMLLGASHPVILMGRVSRSEEDWAARVRLAERLGALVITVRADPARPRPHLLRRQMAAGANRPGDADQQPGNGRLSRRRRRCRAGGCGQGRRRGQGSLSGLARPAGAGEVGAPASGRRHSARTCRGTGAHRRVFVHEDILDDVLSVLPQSLSAIRVGLPTDPDATMGSLSSEMQYRKTLEYIEIAKSEGARLVFGGRALTDGPLAGGFYIEPTVFADVTDDMRIAREEVFGPVLSILSWRDEADVIRRVNALDVGLTAAVWTNDIDRAHRMAARIEAGYVWINDVSTHEIGMPFGGYKQSGFGKEEAFEEMLGYTREKNIHLKYRA